jgi:hypothetical protein
MQGLGLLAVSTLVGHHCNAAATGDRCPAPPTIQVTLFYVSLYMVAVGEGGHKPCAHAFGADQFDQSDPGESVSRSSFFNWWYFGVCAGTAATLLVVSYVQESLGWHPGFAIPCAVMACTLVVFLLGTRTYRYTDTSGTRNLFAHAAEAFAGWRRRQRSRLRAAHRTSHQASHQGVVGVSAEEPPEARYCTQQLPLHKVYVGCPCVPRPLLLNTDVRCVRVCAAAEGAESMKRRRWWRQRRQPRTQPSWSAKPRTSSVCSRYGR